MVKELSKTKVAGQTLQQLKKQKVSKVIGGHLMAIRDKRRATMLEHGLFDHGK